jgi:hypothetical protein
MTRPPGITGSPPTFSTASGAGCGTSVAERSTYTIDIGDGFIARIQRQGPAGAPERTSKIERGTICGTN